MRNSRARVGLAGMVAALPMLAHASGRLPMPPSTQAFPSHAACVTALDRFAAEDRRRVAPRTVDADGRTGETSLDTKGVERTGPTSARYEATLWSHHAIAQAGQPFTETTHTFEQRLRTCEGALLHTEGESGYTSSTIVPAMPSVVPR